MGDNLFAYVDWLEIMAFFSGYPLVYAIFRLLGETRQKKIVLKGTLIFLLPFSYALVGTLYLGLLLKNLYPDYSAENIKLLLQGSYLKIWALFAISFWIPALRKKTVLSLLHSLVFFFFLMRDLLLHFFQSTDGSGTKNDINIYTISLLINLASFVLILLIYFLFTHIKKGKKL